MTTTTVKSATNCFSLLLLAQLSQGFDIGSASLDAYGLVTAVSVYKPARTAHRNFAEVDLGLLRCSSGDGRCALVAMFEKTPARNCFSNAASTLRSSPE